MRREQLLEMQVAEKQRVSRAAGTMRKELRHDIAYLKGRIKQIEEEMDERVRRSEAWRSSVRSSQGAEIRPTLQRDGTGKSAGAGNSQPQADWGSDRSGADAG